MYKTLLSLLIYLHPCVLLSTYNNINTCMTLNKYFISKSALECSITVNSMKSIHNFATLKAGVTLFDRICNDDVVYFCHRTLRGTTSPPETF